MAATTNEPTSDHKQKQRKPAVFMLFRLGSVLILVVQDRLLSLKLQGRNGQISWLPASCHT